MYTLERSTEFMLKAIGYFIADLSDEFPAPQELVVETGMSPAIADYLDNGLKLVEWRGHSWCRFCCEDDASSMGNHDLTDGVWVWPESLSHYVRNHGVSLPPEFCRHALSGKSAFLPDQGLRYDYTAWNEWAFPYRNTSFRSRIECAKCNNQQKSTKELQMIVDKISAIVGEGDEECDFCNSKALRGMYFCANHHPLLQNNLQILIDILRNYDTK